MRASDCGVGVREGKSTELGDFGAGRSQTGCGANGDLAFGEELDQARAVEVAANRVGAHQHGDEFAVRVSSILCQRRGAPTVGLFRNRPCTGVIETEHAETPQKVECQASRIGAGLA